MGIFDSASDAQTAIQQLMEDGFSRNSVDLSTQEGSTIDNQSSTYVDESKEDTGGIGGFFASLFGMDDDETRRRRDNYTTVAARHSVVTVLYRGC